LNWRCLGTSISTRTLRNIPICLSKNPSEDFYLGKSITVNCRRSK
jgi:hypothetical protein